jgi:hypothetical protein
MTKKLSLMVLGLAVFGLAASMVGGCGNSVTTYFYYYPDWTPDGRILCSKNKQVTTTGTGGIGGGGGSVSNNYYLTIMDANGSNEVDIKSIDNSAKVAASPLGNYYAYAESGSNYIKIVDTSGNDVNSIDCGANIDSLDWGPDEAKLVFGIKTSATSEIYTVNRGGTAKNILTIGENVAWRFGNRIFFEHKIDVYSYLGSIFSDGTGFYNYGDSSVYSPQILSSNTNYCFGKALNSYRRLDVSVTPEIEVILFSPFNGYLPKLSMLGDKIAYTDYSDAGIWVVSIAGTGEVKLK